MTLALPSRYTPSLTGDENFPSDADWFQPIADLAFQATGRRGKPHEFYDFQKWLLRHALETFPEGHPKAGTLRFRQVLISMARQNGKTELGAEFGIYGLLREAGDKLIGVASNAEQARVLYSRTMQAIRSNKAMAKKFRRLTETRGIESYSGSSYEIRASKGEALQGIPIELGLIDEVHIVSPDIFQAIVAGTGGRDDAIVIMLTTAGDDQSQQLIELYRQGEEALLKDPADNRFGFFVYEAPEPKMPETREEIVQYALAANPKMAEGHTDIDNFLHDISTMHPSDILRYHFNCFVSSVNSFITLDQWMNNYRGLEEKFPQQGRPVFSIERTRDWSAATITVATKVDNLIHTEVVASIVNPKREQLFRACMELRQYNPLAFVMDGYRLRDLYKELTMHGLGNISKLYSSADIVNACSTFYAKVASKGIRHSDDEVHRRQIPLVLRKNVGENFVISRTDSAAEIDSIFGLVFAVYGAETIDEIPLQVFG